MCYLSSFIVVICCTVLPHPIKWLWSSVKILCFDIKHYDLHEGTFWMSVVIDFICFIKYSVNSLSSGPCSGEQSGLPHTSWLGLLFPWCQGHEWDSAGREAWYYPPGGASLPLVQPEGQPVPRPAFWRGPHCCLPDLWQGGYISFPAFQYWIEKLPNTNWNGKRNAKINIM